MDGSGSGGDGNRQVNVFGEPLDNIFALYPGRVVNHRSFAPKVVFGIEGRL